MWYGVKQKLIWFCCFPEKFNPLDEVRRLYPQFYEKKPKAGSVDDRKSNILMTMIKAYGGINKYILDGVDPNSPEALKRCRYIRLKGQPIEVTDVSLTDLLDGKTSKVDNSESDKPIDKTEEHLPQIWGEYTLNPVDLLYLKAHNISAPYEA